MTTYGISEQGFIKKTFEIIKQEMIDDLRAKYGDTLNCSDDTILGQFIGIISYYRAEGWEVDQAVYNSFSPSTAIGVALSRLVEVNGIQRLSATRSLATVRITGTPGTLVPYGFQVAVAGSNNIFAALDDRTIGQVGYVDILFECMEFGTIYAPSGTLTSIRTPISGIISCTNINDAVVGRTEETDVELRQRRNEILALGGTGTIFALHSSLRVIDGVIEVKVLENWELEEVDGIPGKSFEAIVLGGESQDVAQTIWLNKPGGIKPHGQISETIQDTQNYERVIKFTRPEDINIYINISIQIDENKFPLDGIDQIRNAIVDFGNTFAIGQLVKDQSIYRILDGISGINDIIYAYIGTDENADSEANLSINTRQIARFSADRIMVEFA